jgi:hypothetical protein
MEETAISNHIASFQTIRSKIEREVTQEREGENERGTRTKTENVLFPGNLRTSSNIRS